MYCFISKYLFNSLKRHVGVIRRSVCTGDICSSVKKGEKNAVLVFVGYTSNWKGSY